jgi:hypothetical protein
LPTYAFVPGKGLPHPRSHPLGHSFGRQQDQPQPLVVEAWCESIDYLHGLDLFNNGFYWEAHEAWEGLWHAAGRRGPTADFLKALIKLAAAGVKHLEGVPPCVKTHAKRAGGLFRSVALELDQTGARFLGLSLAGLVELSGKIELNGWPESPVILVPDMKNQLSQSG